MSMPVAEWAISELMARQQRQSGPVQVVRQTMMNHRQNARVAEQHFIDTARRRIAVIGGQHVGVQ